MTAPQGWNAALMLGSPWTILKVTKVTLGATATALPPTALANRRGLWLLNPSAIVTSLGDSTVTTTNEMTLRPQGEKVIPCSDAVSLYALPASGTPTIVVWEWA